MNVSVSMSKWPQPAPNRLILGAGAPEYRNLSTCGRFLVERCPFSIAGLNGRLTRTETENHLSPLIGPASAFRSDRFYFAELRPMRGARLQEA